MRPFAQSVVLTFVQCCSFVLYCGRVWYADIWGTWVCAWTRRTRWFCRFVYVTILAACDGNWSLYELNMGFEGVGGGGGDMIHGTVVWHCLFDAEISILCLVIATRTVVLPFLSYGRWHYLKLIISYFLKMCSLFVGELGGGGLTVPVRQCCHRFEDSQLSSCDSHMYSHILILHRSYNGLWQYLKLILILRYYIRSFSFCCVCNRRYFLRVPHRRECLCTSTLPSLIYVFLLSPCCGESDIVRPPYMYCSSFHGALP